MIITAHVARLADGSGWSAAASANRPSRGAEMAYAYCETRRRALTSAVGALLDKLEAAGDITQELEVEP